MQTFSAEEFDSVGELLKATSPVGPGLINANLKITGKLKALLKTGNVKSVKIEKEGREFQATSPIYVRSIEVVGEDLTKIVDGLSVVAIKLDGTRLKLPAKATKFAIGDATVSGVSFAANIICNAIEVKSTLPWRSLSASKIRVVGYSLEQLDSIADKTQSFLGLWPKIDSYVASKKADAAAAEQAKGEAQTSLDALEEQIDNLTEEKQTLESEIATLKTQNEIEKNSKRDVDKSISESRSTLEAIRNNSTQLQQSVESMNREIAQKKVDLERLINDRSLISDEYRDYVAEGKQQSRVYEWFLYFSIVVIAVCVWQLYSGATRILEAHAGTLEDLLTLSLQRAPFAAALGVAITVSWKLASLFVNRIMTIHAQRLALARLLVIAKDTVYSSAGGLDVSDETRFRERIRLKLAMLRGHLTSELGRDFEYDPDEVDAEANRGSHAEQMAVDQPNEDE